ncbi:hypothetical protein BCR35DRAFT_288247 [Leucosporidium creatinivorum]|uniref:NAD-dependent epimerase/dehydratase domain-containing protein n=1 Tax=Leucosporidium creatinivorum TaxID=106004 RepID=A0A1Y2G255_9BASI|nr:hypothetical protein BCR35DRAFT_288247 [Leucosporidium creatinivorum]
MSFPPLASLPSHIHKILITGAGGYVGAETAKLLLELYPGVKLVLCDLKAPQSLGDRTETRAGDLCNAKVAEQLIGDEVDAILAFQGIMSGQSEANHALGYAVNIDSHKNLLEAAKKVFETKGKKITFVHISGLAVFGGERCKPEAFVDPMTTPLFPETSYGTAKAIAELYLNDYSRKGYVDGRTLRLPTVAIRAGAPSSAASSFISGIIREPLQGLPAVCPVATGPNDPAMDTVPIYLSRASTVFRNIVHALVMPAEKFPSYSRTVGVPGITVTPRQIVEALEKVGGKQALDLVTYEKDPKVIHIMQSWPGAFDNTVALGLGFVQDDPKTGFMLAVEDFKAGLKT